MVRFLHVLLFLLTLHFASAQPNLLRGPNDRRRRVPIPVDHVAGSIIQGSYMVEMCDASSASADELSHYILSSGVHLETDIQGRLGGRGTFRPHLSLVHVNQQALDDLRGMEMVCRIEPDQVVTVSTTRSWGTDRIDQPSGLLDGNYVHENQLSAGAGTVVYVLDTGIDPSHVEFGGRAISGWCNPNLEPSLCACDGECTSAQQSIDSDQHNHGTHCAGTAIGATVGVAPGARAIGVKVLSDTGSGSYAGVIAGMEWAKDHSGRGQAPGVISMSLGGGSSTTMNNAVNDIVNGGMVVVVAAGNDNTDACSKSPAGAVGALTIGATTSEDTLPAYTNYGPCVDLYAPGSSITSIVSSGTNDYDTWSGTSMACPHVAGAVALLLQEDPRFTPNDIESRVKGMAVKGDVLSGGDKCNEGNCHLLQVITGPIQSPAPTPSSPTSAPSPKPPTTSILCTFDGTTDDGNCPLQGSGSLPWTLRSGTTPSTNTGPSSDHTSGSGSYYYTEATGQSAGSVYLLEGESPPGTLQQVTFWYHMFGASMGMLDFEVSSNDGASWTSHWSKTGDQGEQWHMATTSLVNQDIDNLRFRGVRGSGFRSDMAIDDVSLVMLGNPSPPPVAPTTAPTKTPTLQPALSPTLAPTLQPTVAPTTAPTKTPTLQPALSPTLAPTLHLTVAPTTAPTTAPTLQPALSPTLAPTLQPVTPPTPQENPPSPISCNFEESNCGLQAANLPWILRSGSTPSSSTGPSGDHTSGSGNYYYIEATGQSSGSVHLLETALTGNLQSVSFWYHMWGSAMGEMHFETSTDDGNSWTSLWLKVGNQGNQWSQSIIGPINQEVNALRFRGVRGSGFLGFRSDMAIDDLEVVFST